MPARRRDVPFIPGTLVFFFFPLAVVFIVVVIFIVVFLVVVVNGRASGLAYQRCVMSLSKRAHELDEAMIFGRHFIGMPEIKY